MLHVEDGDESEDRNTYLSVKYHQKEQNIQNVYSKCCCKTSIYTSNGTICSRIKARNTLVDQNWQIMHKTGNASDIRDYRPVLLRDGRNRTLI